MALNTVSSDRLSTNVKNTNFTAAEKQDLTDDILPLAGQLGNRNLIINGAMNVAQRGTSSTGLGASAGYFTLDRFRTTFNATAGRVTMEQVADVHDGFANALKFSCTTADTSVAAGEYFMLQQKIEGQNLQQLKKGSSDAEEFTVSFYVKGNASATYVVEMFDLDNTRQISKTFSVTTNWTRVELTFPGDTTGAFDDDNAASLQLAIWLHAGSTYSSGTLNSSAFAANTNANRAVGISSIFDSTARTFFITGLQLEVGSVATDFEHRSFDQDLQSCFRYCQVFDSVDGEYNRFAYANAASGSSFRVIFPLMREMRAKPSVAFSGAFQCPGVGSFNINNVIMETNTGSRKVACLQQGSVSVTSYQTFQFNANGDTSAKVTYSAEL
jgi:hypothetical protein